MSRYIYSSESFVFSAYLGIVFTYAIDERTKMTTVRKACVKVHTDLLYGKSTEVFMWLLMSGCFKRCILLLDVNQPHQNLSMPT